MTNKTNRASNVDGRAFPMTEADIEIGNVVRQVYKDGTAAPFADSVIVAVYDVDRYGNRKDYTGAEKSPYDRNVRLARPYIYVSHPGICATTLTGVEDYSCTVEAMTRADSVYRVVVRSTGEPSNQITGSR
jgi:hypothetical protein